MGLTGNEEITEENPIIVYADHCPSRPEIRDLDKGCDPMEDGLGVHEITYSCGPWEDSPDPVVKSVKNLTVKNFLVSGVSYQEASSCFPKKCFCCPDDEGEGWHWFCGDEENSTKYTRDRIEVSK